MNNYLIFRTDRIGDYILSQILINSISRNDKKSRIYIIASEKNFFYVNRFSNIYKVFLFKKKILLIIKLFFSLKKINFHKIIVLDGKRRSFFFSLFILFFCLFYFPINVISVLVIIPIIIFFDFSHFFCVLGIKSSIMVFIIKWI